MNLFPRLTRLSTRALLGVSLLFNLPFILLQTHLIAFDTYVHIFLADHYRRAWFNLWEPRWYLGFSVASYPPLIHQLIALLSRPLEHAVRWFTPSSEPYPSAWRWAGLEAAYLAVLLAVLLAYPLVVRAFARLFVGPRAAGLAGLLAIFLPGLGLVLWSFGQLPSTAATAVVLLAVVRGHHYLASGRGPHLLQAVALAAVAAAIHHGVFLLVPFLGAAVVVQYLLRNRVGRIGLMAQSPGRKIIPLVFLPSSFILRLSAWPLLSALAVALVLWPLLAWSRGQDLQAPIDHLSRHNLLRDARAAMFFFWPVYGPLLLALPWVGWAAVRVRRWRLLVPALLSLMLLVLGLGGTTPLPRLLYGQGWAWLTYERFAFWAALALLPLVAAGLLFIGRRQPLVAGLFLGSLLIAAAIGAGLSTITRSQPPAVDMAPLVRFLSQPEQRPYRYFTLGFGDQLARLSVLVDNGTPDGTYHTARALPELRESGIGAIDTVMWTHEAWYAGRFLAQADRYGARWAFVNHAHYPDVLAAVGWIYRFDIGAVQAWEKPDVLPVPIYPPPGLDRSPAALWWGLAPLAALALAVLAHALAWPWRAWRLAWTRPQVAAALGRLRLWLWALTIVLLCLWWYHSLYTGAEAWVYFVYQSVLIFAADLAAVATLAAWTVERVLRGVPLALGPRPLLVGGLSLIAASVLSLQDSVAVPLTLGVVAHLGLLAVWYLMLVNDPPTPRTAGTLLVVLGGTQALIAAAQAATQTTSWLNALGLPWPGAQTVHTPGVSVVQTLDGGRWLRAYGTLSHPNILGGYLLPGLAAAVERYAVSRWPGWLVAGWLVTGGLLLTFSRSAWLGAGVLAAAAAWLWLNRRAGPAPDWARLRRWVAVGAGALILLGLPLLPLVLARASLGAPLRLEQRSLSDRMRLNQAAVGMLLDRPVSGVGAGAFVVRLHQVAGVSLPLEPAHNLPLLLAAEMGGPGVVAVSVLSVVLIGRLWARRRAATRPEALMGAALLGMLAIGLFDHYWWTMLPARMLLVTILGLWVGWATPPQNHARAGSAPPATQSAAPPPG